jgi:hypothetical protein
MSEQPRIISIDITHLVTAALAQGEPDHTPRPDAEPRRLDLAD